MTAWLYFTVKALHLFGMTLWTGGPLVAPVGLMAAVREGGERGRDHVRRMQALTPYFVGGALLTLATGAPLLWAGGGFSTARPTVLVGAVVALLTFPLGGAVIRPTLLQLDAALAAKATRDEVEPLLRRFLAAHAAEIVLKTLALALMVIPALT